MNHGAHHPGPQSSEGFPGLRRDADPAAPAGDRGAAPDQEVGRLADREVPLRVAHEDARIVVEHGTGRRWQVREVDARCVPAARGDRCLIFDAECVVRRLWSYPANWRQLPGDELLRLATQ